MDAVNARGLQEKKMAHSSNRKYASPLSPDDWARLLSGSGGPVAPSERELVQQLSLGRSQTEIAAAMGVHRSAVWRQAKKLADRLQKSTNDK